MPQLAPARSSPRPKTIVILQSNYLPWRGYFDLMRRADIFVILDVVQYTKNDWRNRNRIKSGSGVQWLTIPVHHSLSTATAIDETRIADPRWADRHIGSLRQNYSRAAAFRTEAPWLFAQINAIAHEELLSTVNGHMLLALARRLGIDTPIVRCTDYLDRKDLIGMEPSERLLALCKTAGASRYLSGPAARSYLDAGLFLANGVEVAWMSYDGYPDYPQFGGAFEPQLSTVDLLLNCGAALTAYLPPL